MTDTTFDAIKALHFANADADYLQKLESEVERDPTNGRIISPVSRADWIPGLPAEKQTKAYFSKERVLSKYETMKNGEPTYIIQEFITVIPPRDFNGKAKQDFATVHTLATPIYQFRFPKEYEAFKKGKQTLPGMTTPLTHWPAINTDAQLIEEMASNAIKTVEDLATTGDIDGTRNIKNFSAWKVKAKTFLAEKNKPEATIELEAKLEEQQKKSQAEIDALRKQVESLLAQFGGDDKKASKQK